MARILVHEPDAVFRALIEDWLHDASHRVSVAETPRDVQAIAVDGEADALVLEIDLPGTSGGLDLIRSLRSTPQTRHLPIVVVSHRDQAVDRVEALRIGADDYLVKPCDPEELVLRLDKLLQRRAIDPSALEGHLGSHSAWDLVQFLQNSNQTGNLIIQGGPGPALIAVRRGDAVAATWGELEGPEALLAILGQTEGSFRFVRAPDPSRDSTAEGDPLSVRQLLMEAAWIEDELRSRARSLPGRGVPLQPTGKGLGNVSEDFETLPLQSILEEARGPDPVRLYDLQLRFPMAPQKISLTVAFLVENEILEAVAEDASADVLTTRQIDSLEVLKSASGDLLSGLGGSETNPVVVSYLLLAEPGAWTRIESLFTGGTEPDRAPIFRRLSGQLERGFGGSVSLQADHGKIFFHVQMLKQQTRLKVDQVAPLCQGIVLWLEAISDVDLVRTLMERFSGLSTGTRAVIVTDSINLPQLRRLGTAARGWTISEQHPRGLLGVIRLLSSDSE